MTTCSLPVTQEGAGGTFTHVYTCRHAGRQHVLRPGPAPCCWGARALGPHWAQMQRKLRQGAGEQKLRWKDGRGLCAQDLGAAH